MWRELSDLDHRRGRREQIVELAEHGVHVAHDLLDAATGAGAVRVNEDACVGTSYDSPVEDV